MACLEFTGADSGGVHLLDLQSGRFAEFAGPADDRARSGPLAGSLSIGDARIFPSAAFRAAVGGRLQDGTVVVACRRATCIGAIRLDGVQPESLSPQARAELLATADLLVPIYEDRFAFNLLTSLQESLDYTKPWDDFIQQVEVVIGLSSGMEFAALREVDETALRCIALVGLGSDAERSQWDLAPVEDSPAFARALAGETVAVTDVRDPEHRGRVELSSLDPVRSYVTTPVRVGQDVFGVLSFGARCPFEYAPLELRGFESIANGIGVAIANFRNSHTLAQRVEEFANAAAAVTVNEVAQSVRHEMAGTLDTCQWQIASIATKLGRHAALVDEELKRLSATLQKANAALKRLQMVGASPGRGRQPVSLRGVWEEARTALAGRLHSQRVAVHFSGPDVEVSASPDWLRQVFLNLILNSCDAFADAKKGGRRIELAVDKTSVRAKQYTLTYRDNATGISPQRLSVPDQHSDMPLQQLIFEPNVTSKPGGSGFGLWLVRRILGEYEGSIDLTDHRGGVAFTIRLPRIGAGDRS